MCGVATTCGSICSRWSTVGSLSNTSSPAPATWPDSMASASAASSIRSPRAVLMMRMPLRARASRSAFTRCRVCGVDGRCSDT